MIKKKDIIWMQLIVPLALLLSFIFNEKYSLIFITSSILIEQITTVIVGQNCCDEEGEKLSIGLYMLMTIVIQLTILFTIWELFFDFEIFKLIIYMLVFAANALVFSFIIGDYRDRRKKGRK